MQRRKNLMPPSRHAKQRRKKRLIYFGVGILLVCGACWGIVAFSQSKMIAITEIKVSGGAVVEPQAVISIAEQELHTKYLYFISKDNSLLYPRSKIKEDIMKQLNRVKEVNIAVESNNVLHIELSERKPFALWCKEVPDEKDNCYFLDSEGLVFAKAPNFYGNVFFKYYDVIATPDPIGQRYMSAQEIKNIQDFARHVSELGLVPVSLKVKTLGEFDFVLEKGGRIIFSDKDPYTASINNLSTLLSSQPSLKDESNLDYIDLRFGNKLSYKLKNSSILRP